MPELITANADPARLPVFDRRRAGVLLHPTSLLPATGGGGGSAGAGAGGALGAPARGFIDWLAASGFSVWQLLPLGPPGPHGSPYWVRSDHAGDPRLLGVPEADRAGGDGAAASTAALVEFRAHAAAWLDDYAMFVALAEAQQGRPWWEWPAALRDREPAALRDAGVAHAARIEEVVYEQFRFEREWRALRAYAHERGVRIFGDLPIYLSPDSVDVWVHRSEFQLDSDGRPLAVAGVPPDYFSATGQLWGNPLYDWAHMQKTEFAFWRSRVRQQLERFDLLRIDHFRGLAAYWSVPASAPDARGGVWKEAPGQALLETLAKDFPELPLVAEDLGVITPDVVRLRTGFGLAGMRVLQFGFDGNPTNIHLPHNYSRDSVVYTGTHDNDTSLGWYSSLDAGTLQRVDDYLRLGRYGGTAPGAMPEALVRTALGAVAELAIVPAQDLLGLDSSARLNTPGTVGQNWEWRLPEGALTPELAREYARLNRMFDRTAETRR
jgi:4-alpha-glucanotransferase